MMDLQEGTRLDPAVVTLWRLQRLVRTVVVGLPALIGLGFFASSVIRPELAAVLVVTLIAMKLVFALFWPSLEYNAYRYVVRDHDLLVQHGVLFRRWSSVPHSRIQHVDMRQGPMERIFGLSRLIVFTAAGSLADAAIPGLRTQDAEYLRDELSRRGGDDGV